MKLGTSGATVALAPALVETYSRLLVYMEIESLGIKGFISHLLPTVFKSHAWGILHTLLEMFSYRLHHIQPVYRVTLLSHLHSIASVPNTNQNQLQLCVESTALRLITGLGSSEVQAQLTKFLTEPKQILSSESEELNRAESCGNWCEGILRVLVSNTPHRFQLSFQLFTEVQILQTVPNLVPSATVPLTRRLTGSSSMRSKRDKGAGHEIEHKS
ncbi:Mediator of RNA polymerase II transcription subunit 23 [Exaiptasia diaphana]|nr:Mediator of RNA polymerase II transcription subunit 23 [Exaiptasia diaphana]